MRGAVRYAVDRLVASDPGRSHLRTGAWALLTAAVGSALLLFLAHRLGLSDEVALVGVIVAVMSTVVVQDATSSAQRGTLAWVVVVCGAIVLLGEALADSTPAAGVAFLAVIVGAFEARRFGARGTALGTMAVQAFFYALLLHPDPEQWRWVLASIAAGCAIAAVVRFVAWPERPHAVLASELQALRAGVASLLHEEARRLEGRPRWAGRTHASLARLNDLSLQLEQRLGRDAGPGRDALRDAVLRSEIAAETLHACGAAAAAGDAGQARAMAAAFFALRDAVRCGTAFDPAAWTASLEPLDADQRWRFARAAGTLTRDPPWCASLPPLQDTTATATPAAQPRPPRPSVPWRWLSDPPTRLAVQAGAAALVAMVAGHAVSAEHWFWAVFGAFVIFLRGGTRGQAAAGAWQRTLGNAAGLGLGLALAEVVQGHPRLELVLLFVFVAAGFYVFQSLQQLYLALLTAMLAMLYELLGMYSAGLLLTRLAEMMVGAAAAVLSALVVLPGHTSEQSDRESVALLREAAGLLRRVPRGTAREGVRDLDRHLQSLRQALGPVTTPDVPAPKSGHRRRLYRLAVVVYCVRHLCNLAADADAQWRGDEILAQRAVRVAEHMEQLAAFLAGDAEAPSWPALPDARPTSDEGRADPRRIALHWLAEADGVLRSLVDEENTTRHSRGGGNPGR